MDLYNKANTLSIEEQEDEPFYCSPACAEGDVICPGSDSEETAEETERKRLRYEHHARRYLRGHLPVLQSATLRGSLSGWVNPWRWIPKQDEWWQPGSEDMLFTREKVMQRAADHGFGYLGPTQALAWCKASAQAEAQRINRHGSLERDVQPEIGSTLMELDTEESQDNFSKAEPLTLTLEATNHYEDQSMINHHSETPYTDDHVKKDSRGTKRPVDAQWLKGSYVSKRARWDGPEIATPTPHHELRDKPRRRHQSFSERSGSNNIRSYVTSRLSVSFADIASPQEQIGILLNTVTPDFASHDRGQASVASAPNSTNKRSSLDRSVSIAEAQQGENDELEEISRESFLSSSLRNRSSSRSQRRSRRSTDAPVLNLEPNELDAIAPHQHSSSGIVSSSSITQNITLSSTSNNLPKPRRKTPGLQNGGQLRDFNEEDDYSFVTEVAPSSRGLEMFRYRKKRKRDSEVLKTNRYLRDSAMHFQRTPGEILPSGNSSKGENSSDDEGSIGPKICNRMNVSPHIDEVPVAEDELQNKSNQSDESWDFMDDAIEQPSALLGGHVLPTEATSPSRASRGNHNSPIPIPQILKSAPKHSSQRSKMSLGSSHHSQSLPDPQKSLPKTSAARGRVGIYQDPNDGSTQSYNTSPPRPTPHLPLEPLPCAMTENYRHKSTSSVEIQDVISNSQKIPSQHGPPFASPSSMRSNNSRSLDIGGLDKIVVASHQEPPLVQSRAPRSSVSQISVERVATTTDREVDEHAEIANLGEMRGAPNAAQLQSTPQLRLSRAASTGKEPEPEASAKPSPIIPLARAKHNSLKNINELRREARHDQSEACGDNPRDGAPATGALGESRGRTDTGIKAANIDSETSWEGCGPQSPWAAENLEFLSVNSHVRLNHSEPSKSGSPLTGGLDQRLSSPDSDDRSEELDWQPVEKPQTPAGFITPFKDLMSPTPEPEASEHRLESNGLPNTQSLIDGATNNPWASNLRNSSSKKPNKRVSFNVVHSEEKENSLHYIFDETDHSRRDPGSPPPPQHDSDEDIYDDGTATIPKFIGHFLAARQFKHILPHNTNSPLNSSPHPSAQAEAFIAADRRVSVDERRSKFSPRSPSRKFKARREFMEEKSWTRDNSPGSVQISPKSPEKRIGNLMASFDMEDAIGDMSDFLGDDWSVDVELKKAKGTKESESSGRRESNGHKRRRLFGLV